jgi:glucose/arabinose dehydrogenase
LRNPWKFSFDRITGDLWIADVGQNAIEEINFQPAGSPGGENYGWRCYEGNMEFAIEGCPASDSFAFPVDTYSHGEECSVTGGYVYRGDSLSPYYGYYFYADYCSDRIWTLHNESGKWIRDDFGHFPGNNFSAFGEDFAGQLYIAGHESGNIYRLAVQPTHLTGGKKSAIKILQFPGTGRIRIEATGDITPGMFIEVSDTRGILQYRDQSWDSVNEFELDHLPPGIYIVSVKTNGKNFVQKIFLGP